MAVLAAVPGLKCQLPPDSGDCCGSAGIYSLLEPGLSRQILSRKLESIESLSPDVIATANPGCIMQVGAGVIAAGGDRAVVHPVELLDMSYRAAGYYAA